MTPIVSVIMPVFNAERYVAESIESVFGQGFRSYELIVVDDGSVDRSRQIVQGYGQRLRLIESENRGPSHARNIGIGLARGRFIALLDADDLWRPDKLEQQVACLERSELTGLVHSDLEIINSDGLVEGRRPCSVDRSDFASRFLFGQAIYPSAVLIRTELLRSIGGFSEDFAAGGWEDVELWTRCAERSQFQCISEPLVLFREHPASTTRNPVRRLRNQEILLEKLWARHQERHRRYLHSEFAKLYLNLGKALVRTGGAEEGRGYLKRAIALGGTGGVGLKTTLRACLRLGESYVRSVGGV